MKKTIRKIIAFTLCISLLSCFLVGCSSKGDANNSDNTSVSDTNSGFEGKPVKLKLAHNNAPTTPTAKMIQDWCDAVYEATEGTVTITQYPSDSLGATSSGLDMLDTGITDLFWSTTGMFNGVFNYLDTFGQPLLGQESSVGGTKAIWDTYEDWSEQIDADFAGTKLLIAYQSEAGVIGSNDPVSSMADLKGDVVRSIAGGMADFVTACGASPTFMGPGDIYTNMQKKVINDYVFEWAGVEAFNLAELTPYYLTMNVYRTPMFLVISDTAWDKLSPDQQAAIESVSYREGSLKFAEGNDTAEAAFIKESVDAGHTELIVPSEEAYQEFVAMAEGVWEKWVASLENGEAYFADVKANIAANN